MHDTSLTPTTTLLRLLQITDSTFPTGGYAFSHGLEGLHAMGLIAVEADVREVARAQIEETLAWQDLPAVSHAHHHASAGDLDSLIDLDRVLSALRPVPALRNASTRMGRRTLEATAPLFPAPFAGRLLDAIRDGLTPGHHAVAFGVAAQAAGIEENAAVTAFAASSINSYVAAAVRLGAIGQTAAQRIIAGLGPILADAIAAAPAIETRDFGGSLPLLDIAGMRQPTLPARMFAS